MRKLNTADVFAAVRVVKISGARAELQSVLKRALDSGADLEDVGMDGFLTVLEALGERKVEQAIYEVLAGPLEITPDAVGTMPLDEMVAALKQIAEENDLKHFFTFVSSMSGKN